MSITRGRSGFFTLVPGCFNLSVVVVLRVIGEGAGVIVGWLTASVGLPDGFKDAETSRAAAFCQWDGPGGRVLAVAVVRQRAGVGFIETEIGNVDFVVHVAGPVGDNLEDVGTTVPAAQGGKTPVCRDGSNGRVVGVECVVSGTLKMFWDSTTKENTEQTVSLAISVILIKGQQDEGVRHEVWVVEQFSNPATLPLSSESDVSVVGIVGHVRSDESPLGEPEVLQIIVEAGEVLDLP